MSITFDRDGVLITVEVDIVERWGFKFPIIPTFGRYHDNDWTPLTDEDREKLEEAIRNDSPRT